MPGINHWLGRLRRLRFLVIVFLVIGLVFTSNAPVLSQIRADETAVPEPSLWQPKAGTWQPVASHREDYGKIKVVWLQGTPYEMGYQHGSLLKDEIASLGEEVISSLNFLGRGLALSRLGPKTIVSGHC